MWLRRLALRRLVRRALASAFLRPRATPALLPRAWGSRMRRRLLGRTELLRSRRARGHRLAGLRNLRVEVAVRGARGVRPRLRRMQSPPTARMRALALPLADPSAAQIAMLRRSSLRRAQAGGRHDRLDVGGFELRKLPALEMRRHRQRPVARANQPAHHQSERLEDSSHLAVATLLQHDVIPAIGAVLVAARIAHLLAARKAVLELDAFREGLHLLVGETPHDAHRVFALDLVARVHQPVGELARIGEEQQAFGVVIEAADIDPAAVADRGQLFEHRWSALGIVARDEFARRLVIHQHPGSRLGEADLDELAVDAHLVAGPDLLPDFGRHPVHGDAPGEDHFLHRATRAEAAARQHLVQALRLAEDLVSGTFVFRRRQALCDPLQR
jgi:hypothetical protein